MTPPSLPNDIPDVVDGPRKRRPTERVTENGDPLVQKKAKTASSTVNLKAASTRTTSSTSTTTKATGVKTTKSTSRSRRASFEDIVEPAPAVRSQPRNPVRILEAADGSDDHNDDYAGMPVLIDIDEGDDEDEEDEEDEDKPEDEPEDDDAELGNLLVIPVKHFG